MDRYEDRERELDRRIRADDYTPVAADVLHWLAVATGDRNQTTTLDPLSPTVCTSRSLGTGRVMYHDFSGRTCSWCGFIRGGS